MQLIYQFSSKLIYKCNIIFDEVECGQVLEYILYYRKHLNRALLVYGEGNMVHFI